MYLPLHSSKQMLTQLKKYVKRFRLSFDYMAEAEFLRQLAIRG
jgi:hypothetical protein